MEVDLHDTVSDLPSPSVKDALAFKRELESTIEAALMKFGKQTGLSVESFKLAIVRRDIERTGSALAIKLVYRVNSEVKL